MLPKPTSMQTTDEGTDFQYEGSELHSIVEGVEQFFEDRKYSLKSGDTGHGTYEHGSKMARFLLGGPIARLFLWIFRIESSFVERYSFSVEITKSDDRALVIFSLRKAMSGAMGGIIGHRKMTKEYSAIVEALRAGIS